MALALQRNVARTQRFTVALHFGTMTIDLFSADDEIAVFNDGITVDIVDDPFTPQHQRFDSDPLVTVERG